MFSKEEAKQIRQDFWIMFGKRYQHKWMLYNTGIKDVNFKFSFEKGRAMVSLDIEHADEIFRAYYFGKFSSFQTIMRDEVSEDLIFDEHYLLDSGKEISKIYLFMDGVKIMRKTDWPQVYEFFHKHMMGFEQFYLEYRDFIKE